MNKIYFKTSKFTRILFPFILLFYLVAISYFLYSGSWVTAIVVFLPMLVFFYSLCYTKYVIQKSMFYVKNGFGGRNYTIPWNTIAKISIDKKDIRIDFIKATGKSGFIVIRDVENKEELYHSLQKHLAESLA